MTTMSQGNKITTRKIPATNNIKVLVHTGSLHFQEILVTNYKFLAWVGTSTSTQDSLK